MPDRSAASRAVPLAVSLVTIALLAGCAAAPAGSETAGSAAGPSTAVSQGPAPAPDPADPPVLETGDALDLCAALPPAEVTPVLDAYGFAEVRFVPSSAGTFPDDWPVCTLTSASGAVITLELLPMSFESTIDGRLGPADAPPEHLSAYLPESHAFAAAYGDDATLTATDESATAATSAMLFLTGTALDFLP